MKITGIIESSLTLSSSRKINSTRVIPWCFSVAFFLPLCYCVGERKAKTMDKLRYLLFVLILIGTPCIFMWAGKGFGIQSQRVDIILGAVGLVAGYFIAKGIWGGKED